MSNNTIARNFFYYKARSNNLTAVREFCLFMMSYVSIGTAELRHKVAIYTPLTYKIALVFYIHVLIQMESI